MATDLVAALAIEIRETRLALGISQEAMGDLHRNSVGAIERGSSVPTVAQLERIAQALGLAPSELLARAERRAAASPLTSDVTRRRVRRRS